MFTYEHIWVDEKAGVKAVVEAIKAINSGVLPTKAQAIAIRQNLTAGQVAALDMAWWKGALKWED